MDLAAKRWVKNIELPILAVSQFDPNARGGLAKLIRNGGSQLDTGLVQLLGFTRSIDFVWG
jgi:hypothetical protein